MGGRSRARDLRWALAAGLAIVAAALVATDALEAWERDVYDLMVRETVEGAGHSDRISLILIDENSLDWGTRVYEQNGLDGQGLHRTHYLFPWNRAVYELVAMFLETGGAEVFALDVELAGPHPSGDEAGDEGLGLTTAFQNTEGRPFLLHSLNFETAVDRQDEMVALDPGQRSLLETAAWEVGGWRSAGVPFDRSDVGPYSNPILPYRSILRGV